MIPKRGNRLAKAIMLTPRPCLLGGYGQGAGEPGVEVVERAGAERALLGGSLGRPAQPMAVGIPGGGLGQWREQAEIDVHRLKRAWSGVDGFDMAAGNVAEEGAVGSAGRRNEEPVAQPFGSGKAPRQKPDRG